MFLYLSKVFRLFFLDTKETKNQDCEIFCCEIYASPSQRFKPALSADRRFANSQNRFCTGKTPFGFAYFTNKIFQGRTYVAA